MSESDANLVVLVVFCVSFLGCFVALIGLIPSDFYAYSKEYSQFDVPDYFSQEDIQTVQHFLNTTIYPSVPYHDEWFDFTADVNYKFVVRWYQTLGWIKVYHITWQFFNIWSDFEQMKCLDAYAISKNVLVQAWDADLNVSKIYPVRCDHITIKMWFQDNNLTRNNIGAGFDEGELRCAIGFGFSDYEAKLQAWDVLGRLLTFQSPEVFGFEGGVATTLNLLLALPFYACVGVLIYILILKAIPFVSG